MTRSIPHLPELDRDAPLPSSATPPPAYAAPAHPPSTHPSPTGTDSRVSADSPARADDRARAELPALLEEAASVLPAALETVFASMKESRTLLSSLYEVDRVPSELGEAMAYATLDGGKRLRPALVFGGARAVGGRSSDVVCGACAVELAHAYSLVHDDLPALDDDDERRGKPSCHKKFGEAAAILTGDALLSVALGTLVDRGLSFGEQEPPRAKHRVLAAHELLEAIGPRGMIGGQYDDVVRRDPASMAADALVHVHRRKTGELIRASVTIGALLCGAKPKKVERLRQFGAHVGLAFQLLDDLLDGDGLVLTEGREKVQALAREQTTRAVEALAPLGARARPLCDLALFLEARST